jgi:hypothetical protein
VIIYANEFGSFNSSRLAAMLDVMTVPDSVSSPFSAVSCALSGFERRVEVIVNEISKPFLELRQSKAALEKAFSRSLDTSVIRSGIMQGHVERQWNLVGEGRHFQCFKLPGRGAMDLAVLLARPAFLKGELQARRLWARDLKRLLTLAHPLIPPMEVMDDTEFFAYVQPFCEAELHVTAAIQTALRDLQTALASQELELDDYTQLRSCQGHPFVIDFSELKRLPVAGSRPGFRF